MANLGLLFSCLCSFVVVVVASGSQVAPYFTELETLKPEQKATLQKLKLSVSSILPHDYMKEDIYLVKWLQVSHYSASKAEDMIKAMLKWRKDNKVDEWAKPEFFDAFRKEYPSYQDGFDREGRPVAEAFYGDWNVRAAAVGGKIKHLTLYSLRGLEHSQKILHKLHYQGKNTTQAILLLNMDGFNLINQACPTCLPLYLGLVSQYERYWPNLLYKTIMVNTPESFEIVLNLIRPLMSPQTKASLKVFGTNKSEWKPYLEQLIDPEQISDWFDGKKERKSH